MKRVGLFLVANLAFMMVFFVTMRVLGVEPDLNANGFNLTSLLIFAAVMGFGGSFISLAISKWSVKKSMGVQVIDMPSNSTEIWLLETVRKYSAEAGIKPNPVWLKPGDRLELGIAGLGQQRKKIASVR